MNRVAVSLVLAAAVVASLVAIGGVPAADAQTRDLNRDLYAIHGLYGIWSDGKTLWGSIPTHTTLYAYNFTNSARDSAKDFALDSSNNWP